MARVLVVEDDMPTATVIADELSYHGHRVDVVGNGAAALESLQMQCPDVMVLDLMLPVVHGWDVIERYRHVTQGKDIPIVVLSAAGAVTRSMEALGVRRFLRKPFDLDDLVDAIADVL
jgi:DNA-binding response OmpR family regulator